MGRVDEFIAYYMQPMGVTCWDSGMAPMDPMGWIWNGQHFQGAFRVGINMNISNQTQLLRATIRLSSLSVWFQIVVLNEEW